MRELFDVQVWNGDEVRHGGEVLVRQRRHDEMVIVRWSG